MYIFTANVLSLYRDLNVFESASEIHCFDIPFESIFRLWILFYSDKLSSVCSVHNKVIQLITLWYSFVASVVFMEEKFLNTYEV